MIEYTFMLVKQTLFTYIESRQVSARFNIGTFCFQFMVVLIKFVASLRYRANLLFLYLWSS